MAEDETKYYAHKVWLRAWLAAVQAGKPPYKASDYADRCLKQFEKRFVKEEK